VTFPYPDPPDTERPSSTSDSMKGLLQHTHPSARIDGGVQGSILAKCLFSCCFNDDELHVPDNVRRVRGMYRLVSKYIAVSFTFEKYM